mmetsp:Transcript_31625/g.79421  ORF Transcript_31625/g.79421 Transcript_31625/m.79421 type:complete len:258 (+) Transcript_31625:374-1147(+)
MGDEPAGAEDGAARTSAAAGTSKCNATAPSPPPAAATGTSKRTLCSRQMSSSLQKYTVQLARTSTPAPPAPTSPPVAANCNLTSWPSTSLPAVGSTVNGDGAAVEAAAVAVSSPVASPPALTTSTSYLLFAPLVKWYPGGIRMERVISPADAAIGSERTTTRARADAARGRARVPKVVPAATTAEVVARVEGAAAAAAAAAVAASSMRPRRDAHVAAADVRALRLVVRALVATSPPRSMSTCTFPPRSVLGVSECGP